MLAGRYRLEERLASGGMGEVWKGLDTRLGREVAVKTLHAGLTSDERFRTRFQLEARAVAALQSPGIVALYDYGEEDGEDGPVSYLVMELVRGRSLAEILGDRGPLPATEVMAIVATAADALATAHRAEIVHRDIKPANLLVNEETGAVKIVDFGIAAARGASGLTETGTVMGTLAYTSPEQLGGTDLSGASDLYSLGCVAYEALMGRPPFVSETPVAVMNGHMNLAPPPLRRDIPAGVAQVVLQALRKDPGSRYGSAADMARSARQRRVVTGGIPVAAADSAQPMRAGATGPDTAPGPTSRFDRPGEGRSRALPWTVTGAVTAAVALMLLLIMAPWDRPDNRISPADEDRTTSEAPAGTGSPTGEATSEEAERGNDGWEPAPDESPTPEDTAEETAEEETGSADDDATSPEDGETSTTPEEETTPSDDEEEPPEDGEPTTGSDEDGEN
ncbi:serine/threonine-protein kinase [Glycomyces xiaoerkulensis]|uniref:serine/threonine-protein kinase n=1 Tax=Glycomyces xiaoerkulensis TaxID=2038139 RepID=UPI000C25B586|nr:serine/threonine-protein kinase [Glycomyces xiaoerkulensis]